MCQFWGRWNPAGDLWACRPCVQAKAWSNNHMLELFSLLCSIYSKSYFLVIKLLFLSCAMLWYCDTCSFLSYVSFPGADSTWRFALACYFLPKWQLLGLALILFHPPSWHRTQTTNDGKAESSSGSSLRKRRSSSWVNNLKPAPSSDVTDGAGSVISSTKKCIFMIELQFII